MLAGSTTDNASVVTNVFPLLDTHGIPFELIVEGIYDRDMVIDWLSFLQQATKAGWSLSMTIAKIEAACTDVLGGAVASEVTSRLRKQLEGTA